MSIPKEFLRLDKIRAVVSIRNLKSDKYYLYTSTDSVKSYSDERFKLDLGTHPNLALQKEYSTLGLELFVIEIDKEAKDGENLEQLLEERKSFYRTCGKILYNDEE